MISQMISINEMLCLYISLCSKFRFSRKMLYAKTVICDMIRFMKPAARGGVLSELKRNDRHESGITGSKKL